jgi:hypothetical protein
MIRGKKPRPIRVQRATFAPLQREWMSSMMAAGSPPLNRPAAFSALAANAAVAAVLLFASSRETTGLLPGTELTAYEVNLAPPTFAIPDPVPPPTEVEPAPVADPPPAGTCSHTNALGTKVCVRFELVSGRG